MAYIRDIITITLLLFSINLLRDSDLIRTLKPLHEQTSFLFHKATIGIPDRGIASLWTSDFSLPSQVLISLVYRLSNSHELLHWPRTMVLNSMKPCKRPERSRLLPEIMTDVLDFLFATALLTLMNLWPS